MIQVEWEYHGYDMIHEMIHECIKIFIYDLWTINGSWSSRTLNIGIVMIVHCQSLPASGSLAFGVLGGSSCGAPGHIPSPSAGFAH